MFGDIWCRAFKSGLQHACTTGRTCRWSISGSSLIGEVDPKLVDRMYRHGGGIGADLGSGRRRGDSGGKTVHAFDLTGAPRGKPYARAVYP